MSTQSVPYLDSIGPSKPEDRFNDDPLGFWEGATFLPLDEPSRSEALMEKVWKSHQSAFLAFTMNLLATQRELCERTDISDCLEVFKILTTERRRQLVEYPPFLSWLRLIVSSDSSRNELETRLLGLKRIMAFVDQSQKPFAFSTASSPVAVARFDVDPLIKEAALPDYVFPDKARQHEFEETVAYPLPFFSEMVTLALERIRRAWPAAHREFSRFVKLIVDMVDADFTSYSGYQHVGVIFVSTDNSPLVGLEEYLMHEFGHQILYNVTELDPIVISEPEKTFRLPWSGRERDLYGYFHAFYVYTLMAHYLTRVERRSKREQKRVSDRVSHILGGLDRAEHELGLVDRFTPKGKHLFENLKASRSGLAKD